MKRKPCAAASGAAAAVLIMLLPACQSSPASPGSQGPQGGTGGAPPASGQAPAAAFQGTAVNACKLLTPAEVHQVTGQTVGPFRPDLPGMKNVCLAFNGNIEVNVSVHPADARTFGLGEPAGSKVVSGLGQKAYCTSLGLMWVLKGNVELGVSARTCAQAAALARIALPRL